MSLPVTTISCTGASFDGTVKVFCGVAMRRWYSSRIFSGATPNEAARRVREAATAAASSCCSGPAFLNSTAFAVASMIGDRSESATGSA